MIIADVIHNEPIVGDRVFIECGDTLIETIITDMIDDDIVIKLDESALQFLDKNKKIIRESAKNSMRYDDFMKRIDELHRAIKAARNSGDVELAKKLQREYDELHSEAERGLLPEGMWDKIKGMMTKMPSMEEVAAKNSLKSLGYLIGLAAQQDEYGSGLKLLEKVLKPNEMQTFIRAVQYANDTDPIKRNSALLHGIERAKSDFAEMDEVEIGRFIRLSFDKLQHGMKYLQMDTYVSNNSASSNVNKPEELSEGWRGKLGALGAAGILGAGAALSPSSYVNGVQYYYSDVPPSAGTQTKTVVDDSGREIIVWTVKKPTGQEKYYYDPKRKQTNEAEYHGRKVSLGKPFLTPDGPKKRSVYVKNPKGNVVKVNFGQKGVKIKKSNPARRKSFRARHNCANPGPRHRARYWSCKFW